MKTLKIFSIILVSLSLSTAALAQKAKSETIPVSGNCGMCKSKIEKAAKTAGVNEAKWDSETKMLTVKYNSSTTNAAKIQQAIAAAGYDTRDVRASDDAYDKLHACCKYERASSSQAHEHVCCGQKCEMKDGKCTNMEACKDKGCCDANGTCKAGDQCKHEGQACCKKHS